MARLEICMKKNSSVQGTKKLFFFSLRNRVLADSSLNPLDKTESHRGFRLLRHFPTDLLFSLFRKNLNQ